ncbi:MAG: transcriptional regulator [Gammaproteobacteria bacterium]|nr:transcriptional regulator [Gammaproteobacteria bacterium]
MTGQTKRQDGNLFATKGAQTQTVALTEASFLRKFIRHITGTLEDIVGLDEAAGYIATVAQRMGEQLNEAYLQSLGLERMNRKQVCKVIADLEKRINGNAEIVFENDEKIVLEGCACPFGTDVADRPSMCMMTTNMLAVIAAENLGFSKVSIEESLSQGDPACRVVIYVRPGEECDAAIGQEFFQS